MSLSVFPPDPTFRIGFYFVGFGFSDSKGLAELIYIYKIDEQNFTDEEVSTLLDANKGTESTEWIGCDSVPSATLNILRKTSFRTYPDKVGGRCKLPPINTR